MLSLLTFTGIDRWTDLEELPQIHKRYPFVEWGVLVGSHTVQRSYSDTGIFPDLITVRRFRDLGVYEGLNTALHLCGNWARSALGHSSVHPIERILKLCEGFGRVQINLHGNYFNDRRADVRREAVERFAYQMPCRRLILQHRKSWDEIPVSYNGVEYLFDRSGGRGKEAFDAWPEPGHIDRRWGYSGGIGPHNILEAMKFVDRYPDWHMWLDMENRVRSFGHLDLKACKTVAYVAFGEASS